MSDSPPPTPPSPPAAKTLGLGRALGYLALFLLAIALIGAGLVLYTTMSSYSANEVRAWLGAAATAISGLGALAAASVAVVAILAQQSSALAAVDAQRLAAGNQKTSADAALNAQKEAANEQRADARAALEAQKQAATEALGAQAAANEQALQQQRLTMREERLLDRQFEVYRALLTAIQDPGAGTRDPRGDFDQEEISDIVIGLANNQRQLLADLDVDVTAFASDEIVRLHADHTSQCESVQEVQVYLNIDDGYLSENHTSPFWVSADALRRGIRAELAGGGTRPPAD